jgi:hypothetical protein
MDASNVKVDNTFQQVATSEQSAKSLSEVPLP